MRKCKVCGERYSPDSPTQNACSPGCALVFIRREREKAEKKAIRKRREALKTKSDWRREAQTAFNGYIRARDRRRGYGCISCGTKKPDIKYDAGHYRSRGAASHLAFNTFNVHLQCSNNCNVNKSGNAVEYRIGLIQRIGLRRVEALENDNEPVTYSTEYLKRLAKIFRRRARHVAKLKTKQCSKFADSDY